MQKKSELGLQVVVEGQDKASAQYLCQVIEKALLEVGVTKVDIVNQQGEHVRRKTTPCLLDIIECYDPNFFTSRVVIHTSAPPCVGVIEEHRILDND